MSLEHDRITEEIQEQAALFALGALSQQEARAFAAHVREGCKVCEQELKQYEEVARALASSATPVNPPAYLRDLLMARIEREQPEPFAQTRVIPFPEGSATKPRPSRSSFAALLPWAVAAALLAAFVYSLALYRSERSASQQANARASEQAQINSVLTAPERRIIPLAGQQVAPNASGQIYWDVQGNRWVVVAELPPPPAGKVYQLWFVTPEAKLSAGLIRTDSSGHAFSVVQYPDNIRLGAAAITLEPEGGSAQPTMPIYALGKPS